MNADASNTTRVRWRWLPLLLFGLTCAFAALDLVFLALSWTTPVPDTWGFRGDTAIFALAYGSVGQLMARRRPENPIGWLFVVAGLSSGIHRFGIEYSTYVLLGRPGALPGGPLAAWTASWLWFVTIGVLFYVFLLFPTGRLPSARWRPVAGVVVGAFALMTFAFMFRPGPLYYAPYLDNPIAITGSDRAVSFFGQVASVGVALSTFLVGASMVLRLRRATGVERQQLKWFAYATGLMCIIGLINVVGASVGLPGKGFKPFQLFTFAIWIAIPFTVGIAILRHRLFDIDSIINRTLVYGALSALFIATYVIVVGSLSALFQTSGNLVISLIATGLVALLFQPLRERLQRGVNRLLYGERDDPFAVLSRLGQRLEATIAPDAILPTIVETVAQALKLPYTAIALKQGDEIKTVAAYGLAIGEPLVLPLVYQSESMGKLILSPRARGEDFSPADRHLLDNIAREAGVAAHAVRLTTDLQRSRERLVTAREEERRRLRRDLHDGLGPALASLTLKTDAARNLLSSDPAAADMLLADLKMQTQSAIADIRRLVYELRPPALDELGLVSALREQAAQYAGGSNGLQVSVVVSPQDLPPLSAAVEVAAYRIALEALTNVVRHAHARRCEIRVAWNDVGDRKGSSLLQLEIVDDGVGLSPRHHTGVGLSSMCERAAELGGICIIELAPGGGTRVFARLPLHEKAEAPH